MSAKGRLILLLTVSTLLAMALVWVRRMPPTRPDLGKARIVADRFLELVCEGQASASWDLTTPDFQTAQSRDLFVATIKNGGVLGNSLHFVAVRIVAIDNSPRAEFSYATADATATVRLLAEDQNGTWRIDRLLVE